ncbi:hypothetical protein NHG32_06685 [Aerococcaceae bacterium NML191219]|nr:hypothetical protein [Aerococcaceae bacterium NML191219]
MKTMPIVEYVRNDFPQLEKQQIVSFDDTPEDTLALESTIRHFIDVQKKRPGKIEDLSPLHVLKKRRWQHFLPLKAKEYRIFIDCKTDGLYGKFLSVGLIFVKSNNDIEKLHYIYNSEVNFSSTKFVSDVVLKKIRVGTPAIISEVIGLEKNKIKIGNVNSEEELLNAVRIILKEFMGAKIFADHLFPTEWRFFERLGEEFLKNFTLVELARISSINKLPEDKASISQRKNDKLKQEIEDILGLSKYEQYLKYKEYMDTDFTYQMFVKLTDNDLRTRLSKLLSKSDREEKYNHIAWYDAYQGYLKFKPISSHVFILPFIIDGIENKDKIKVGSKWKKLSKEKDEFGRRSLTFPHLKINNYPLVYNNCKKSIEFLAYNFNQFFNDEAMDIIMENSDSYILDDDELEFYDIHTHAEDRQSTKLYRLYVKYVMMRLVGKNSGFLIISLDNHLYDSLADVRNINQYGRRVYDPFKLQFVSDMESSKNILLSPNQDWLSHRDKYSLYIKDAIKELMETFFDSRIPIFPKGDTTGLAVHRILDDRMFVLSNYSFDQVGDVLRIYAERGRSETNPDVLYETEKKIYSWIYVDKGDACCQSRMMIKNQLNSSLYDRWIDLGTLYGITQHSMIMMTSHNVPNYIPSYFFTEYLEMILIVLVQRIGILYYSDKAGEQAHNFNSSKLLKLQKNYVQFKNQFLLPELSSQEQPIELYDIMHQNLYVLKQKKILDEQIESLYEVSQTEQNNRLNLLVLGLSLITIITAFNDFSLIIGDEAIAMDMRVFWGKIASFLCEAVCSFSWVKSKGVVYFYTIILLVVLFSWKSIVGKIKMIMNGIRRFFKNL